MRAHACACPTCLTICVYKDGALALTPLLAGTRLLAIYLYTLGKVRYHGFFVCEGDVWIFMESMRESLDMTAALLKNANQRFPEHVLGTIAVAAINGLHYLKKELKVRARG